LPPRRLAVVCFWTIRASVKMCSYVVNDKQRYNPDASIMEARAACRRCKSRKPTDWLALHTGCH
jgi:hypothetical protein